ncbi:MAG: hypothetical protein QOD99_3120 [Chthoniobacter sp.]|jgi:Ca2+-binding EF-hand superfamily protein|nr:hypothetical protein [Chthoniobacter sp.]
MMTPTRTIAIAAITTALTFGMNALAKDKEHNEAKKKSAFETMDTDHDGFLTLAEIQAVHPDATAEKIKRHDQDGDGKLSQEEFAAREASFKTAVAEDKHGSKSEFDTFDKNGDGYVTFEEAKAARPNMTEERFKLRDTDGDGKLSREEFTQNRAKKEHSEKAD